jgi:hypothetical protein
VPADAIAGKPTLCGKALATPQEVQSRADTVHLEEIADDAYGDGPLTRGRARDELAARKAREERR